MAYFGRQLTSGNYLKLDDIQSQFNSSTTTFNLTSGGSAFYPGSAFSLLVSINGTVQEPNTDYTINQNTIIFVTAPQSAHNFFCIVLGVSLGIGVPGEGTVSGSKLTEPFDYNDGLLYLDSVNNRIGINSTVPTKALDVVGDARVTGVVTASQFSTGASGTGININTNTISGPSLLYIDPAAVGDNTGAVRIKGDLYVDGTQTVINSTTIDLADFRIGIGTTATSDIVLDGAGIGIGSASNQKTLTWNDTSDALKSSENFDVASGKTYKINGTSVLSNNTLGSSVVTSSLTSVGTLEQLNVTGVSTFSNGPVLVGTATSTGTASQRLQVTGGAYVSGNLGVGTTSPTAKLQVVGDTRVSGVVTAFDFYNDAEYPSVRPTLDLAFAQTKILDSRITFTRASTATYVNASGLIASAAVNEARFDHDPYTGESLGFLVEEARTNEFTNSNPWAGGSNITWTSSQVSPTGGTESYNMVETAANNIHGLSILGGGFTTDYNRHISVFAKSAGRRYLVFWAALGAYPGADSPECIFDLQSGTVVYLDTGGSGGIFETASITNFGNGWYRCGIYLNPYTLANRNLYILMSNSASPQQSSYTGDGSSGVTLFGLQLEAGAFPTSYIPTSGSTVTRSADVASMTGTNFSSWYNQSESTFYTNYILFGLDASYNNPSFYAYENNQNYLAIFGHNPAYGWAQASNATAAGISLGGTTTTNVDYKVSFGVKVNDFAASINGSTVSTDTSGNVPTVSQMFLGKRVEASAAHLNGTLKRFTYYPKRLSNTQLQTITL